MWQLSYHFKFSITEIEDMLPYERDMFIDFTVEELESKKDK